MIIQGWQVRETPEGSMLKPVEDSYMITIIKDYAVEIFIDKEALDSLPTERMKHLACVAVINNTIRGHY